MYYLLLILVAIFSYGVGSLSSITIASMYVFKKNLRKLGRGNVWLSNFRRLYGIGGLLLLLLVEIIRDLIPIFFGGLLLLGKGHPEVGRAFAGFCLIMGRLWPLFYDLRGSHATVCLVVTGFFIDPSVGFAAAAAAAIVLWLTKYFSISAIAGAFVMFVTTLLTVEDQKLITYLSVIILAVEIIRHIPSIGRILRGTETKLSLQNDLSYKFDE